MVRCFHVVTTLILLVPRGALAAGPVDEPPPTPLHPADDRDDGEAGCGPIDIIETTDGRTRRGHILTELQQGFLFHDDDEDQTLVIAWASIRDLQRGNDVRTPPPSIAAPPVEKPAPRMSPGETAARVLASPEYESRRRSVPLAYLLELLVPGAGHMYAGAVGEGITHLLLVTVLPAVILSGLLAGGAALYAVTLSTTQGAPNPAVPSVVTGLLINFMIILVGAVLSARVASVMRAGPAATIYNQRLLGEMIHESETQQ